MSFNNSTRQSFLQLGAMPAYSAGGISSMQLPQVGFLSRIFIPINVAFTTSATGTFANMTAPQITPYQLVRRLILRTNEGAELYNTSGEGNYLIQRQLRTAFDPRNPLTTVAATNVADSVFKLPSSYLNSTAYTVQFMMVIDVAWQDALMAGLILLQNPTTRLTLEIQWGTAPTDFLTIGSGGTTTGVTVTANPTMEIFNLPASENDMPDTSMAYVTLEDTQSVTNTGDFQYKPPLGNLYLRVMQEFINNSARMTPANFTQLKLTYAQTQTAYTMDPTVQAYLQRIRTGGLDLPDGVWSWDFTFGTGLLEMGNTRDVIDTSRLTDLSIISTIASSVTLTNASVRSVRQMLAPISR